MNIYNKLEGFCIENTVHSCSIRSFIQIFHVLVCTPFQAININQNNCKLNYFVCLSSYISDCTFDFIQNNVIYNVIMQAHETLQYINKLNCIFNKKNHPTPQNPQKLIYNKFDQEKSNKSDNFH